MKVLEGLEWPVHWGVSALLELRQVWGSRPLFMVGVSVLLQDEHGRVLLQRRGDDGRWGVIGGGVEGGEDLLTAAQRELFEETGLTCPTLALLPLPEALVSGAQVYHRYPNGHEVYMVGARTHGTLPAEALRYAQPDDSGETLDLRWFALHDLPPISGNINRTNMNLLLARAGLPLLPLEAVPAPPAGDHLQELRRAVGPRPLFTPGADVLLTDKYGKLLLLKPAAGKWALPGGGLHLGETFEDCARRELHEKTGLLARELQPVRLSAGAPYRYTSPHGDVIDHVSVLYQATGVSGTLHLQADEILEAGWFSPAELPAAAELNGPLVAANIRWWAAHHHLH